VRHVVRSGAYAMRKKITDRDLTEFQKIERLDLETTQLVWLWGNFIPATSVSVYFKNFVLRPAQYSFEFQGIDNRSGTKNTWRSDTGEFLPLFSLSLTAGQEGQLTVSDKTTRSSIFYY
jgi:hypothetical protein